MECWTVTGNDESTEEPWFSDIKMGMQRGLNEAVVRTILKPFAKFNLGTALALPVAVYYGREGSCGSRLKQYRVRHAFDAPLCWCVERPNAPYSLNGLAIQRGCRGGNLLLFVIVWCLPVLTKCSQRCKALTTFASKASLPNRHDLVSSYVI